MSDKIFITLQNILFINIEMLFMSTFCTKFNNDLIHEPMQIFYLSYLHNNVKILFSLK
jgi:predicted HAD superfamily hydrolase